MVDDFDYYLDSLCEKGVMRARGKNFITITQEFCSHVSKVYYGNTALGLEDAIAASILDFYHEGLGKRDLLKIRHMVVACFCGVLGTDIRRKDRVQINAALDRIFKPSLEDLKG